MTILHRVCRHSAVVRIERWLQREKRRDAAGGLGDIAYLGHGQAAPQQGLLAVREPFLDDLIPADRVFPYGHGHVAPAGRVVEVDVQTGGRRPEVGGRRDAVIR